jgi:molybdenum cofactor cytidylyltransferase
MHAGGDIAWSDAMKPAAILLAAGGSRRMGVPKQLLMYQGEALVHRAARTILASGFDPLCVVIGSLHEQVAAALSDIDALTCLHMNWNQGIGTSLRAGLAELECRAPNICSVLIALADQPGVERKHLMLLASASRTGAPVVASAYGGTLGVPAIFNRSLFAQLRDVPNESGAKRVISSHGEKALGIHLETPNDIDTPEDYENLIRRQI